MLCMDTMGMDLTHGGIASGTTASIPTITMKSMTATSAVCDWTISTPNGEINGLHDEGCTQGN